MAGVDATAIRLPRHQRLRRHQLDIARGREASLAVDARFDCQYLAGILSDLLRRNHIAREMHSDM
jgi:hypothetical protein